MAKPPPISEDPRFHHEIWSGPSKEFEEWDPSISYVENHNGDWDYELAAQDYRLATDALIEKQKQEPHFSNWTAPICHLIRQTIELQIKALLQAIEWKQDCSRPGVAFTHDISALWIQGKNWLLENDYHLDDDRRLSAADRLILNLHSIDPSGDLFRFGTSKYHAFNRQKTYDRVGYNQRKLFVEFQQAFECISFWTSVVTREIVSKEMGWKNDPLFDATDFPKLLG